MQNFYKLNIKNIFNLSGNSESKCNLAYMCFPMYFTYMCSCRAGCMLSSAFCISHRMHFFLALVTSCMFSHPWHAVFLQSLLCYLCLALPACFKACISSNCIVCNFYDIANCKASLISQENICWQISCPLQ